MAPSPLLTDPFILSAVAILLAAPAVFLFRRGRKPWLSGVRRKPLLTGNEAEFFYRLQRALPGFHVFPQVSFAAFLTDDGQLSRNAQWAVRARFDRKIADFVVCERGTLKVVALVELDDRLHDAKADRQRDVITKAAGYQTTDHHRNGVCGAPFHVVLFDDTGDENTRKVGILFEEPFHCAVLDVAKLAQGLIAFGVNSYRGDVFEAALRNTLKSNPDR